eukprot:TRINITY_DN9572_c0_g1_i1.p1 TRINITY_DN9572_c0_g1~~TRINITY_DN9572_c0_g1_i1.p1  ORF type:complete len:147 (+),score=25.74 TRINITY_DN9572_c0_g1_i1:123-563(+)
MKVSLLLAIALVCFAAVSCRPKGKKNICSQGYHPDRWSNSANPDPTKRGFMLLTLSWPGSYCSERTCYTNVEIKPDFTIHGLWPNYANSGFPSCCDTTEKFGEQFTGMQVEQQVLADRELKAQLEDEWPVLCVDTCLLYTSPSPRD